MEEFIVEFVGASKDCDMTRWGQFTDIKDIKEEMLTRLEVHFEVMDGPRDLVSAFSTWSGLSPFQRPVCTPCFIKTFV